jgi:hypothetical protein
LEKLREKQDDYPAGDICCLKLYLYARTFIVPLDASGGSVFRKIIGPAMLIEFAPPRQLNRYVAFVP